MLKKIVVVAVFAVAISAATKAGSMTAPLKHLHVLPKQVIFNGNTSQ